MLKIVCKILNHHAIWIFLWKSVVPFIRFPKFSVVPKMFKFPDLHALTLTQLWTRYPHLENCDGKVHNCTYFSFSSNCPSTFGLETPHSSYRADWKDNVDESCPSVPTATPILTSKGCPGHTCFYWRICHIVEQYSMQMVIFLNVSCLRSRTMLVIIIFTISSIKQSFTYRTMWRLDKFTNVIDKWRHK